MLLQLTGLSYKITQDDEMSHTVVSDSMSLQVHHPYHAVCTICCTQMDK